MQNNIIIRQLLKVRRVNSGLYNYKRTICNFSFSPIEKNKFSNSKRVNGHVTLANSKMHFSTKKIEMELEEFEYVVTHPKKSNGGAENVDINTPVVMLFGWANCNDKRLGKYSKLYEDKGMITVRYCVPNRYFFWGPSKMPIVGKKLADLICDLHLDGHQIFVHSFSNGGSTVYLNMSKALDHMPRSLNIKGIIFDSTPGKRRLKGFFQVISEVYREQNKLFVTPRAFLLTAAVSVVLGCENIYNWVNPQNKGGYLEVFRYLNDEKYRWPQHCIYSSKDKIVYAPDVEQFIEHRKKLGIDVTSLRFEDSPHVTHYMYHKEEYTKSVLDFIHKCLKTQENQHDTLKLTEESNLLSKL